MPVFDWQTFPTLSPIYGSQTTTLWITGLAKQANSASITAR